MKIRSHLALLAILTGVALAPGLPAQETLSTNSSISNEYSQLINLLTTFGNNLASRDTATELNDSPNLISSSSDTGTSARLLRSDERLSFFNWLIKDNFNKDKWNVFDNKEWVDAGIPEYGFIQGFSSQLSQLLLQTEGNSRINLNITPDDDKNEGEFQF
ncbi:MAG TPA: hypothetical protein VFW62_05210 [bacterium]|nr:hypothetical protein [bacterium]